MTCPECSAPLNDAAPSCHLCGRILAPSDQPDVAATPEQLAETVPPAEFDPLIGLVLDNRYKITDFINKGAMGRVYAARDEVMKDDDVAVKFLNREFVEDADARLRFHREAQFARRLKHPNIVTIYGVGEAQNGTSAYIVMELLRGKPLSRLLKEEGNLGAERAVSLMLEICAGVGHAHQQGGVHRDLKPDNVIIMTEEHSHREMVKLVDFGLAKLRQKEGDLSLTIPGTVMGTPYYMSPEQWHGHEADARSDVYSLGVMLYEMLAGARPFDGNNKRELQWKHLNEAPPALSSGAGVLSALESVIRRALAKAPEARQPDATVFAKELEGALRNVPLPPIQLNVTLREFAFETVSVDKDGQVTERRLGKAEGYSERIDGECLEMVKVPGGSFWMGSPNDEEGRREDEGPQRLVTVPTFLMGKYEVTQAQWRVVASTLDKVSRDLNVYPAFFRGDKRPVERVSWDDAVEFCARLSLATGREYSLPSEAQWEYACRAETTTPFCTGENINPECVIHDGSCPHGGAPKATGQVATMPVGSTRVANAFGLYDMLGNVWEWCLDIYHSSYDGAPTDGSAWLSGGDWNPRVVRGGSWRGAATDCGSAARNSNARHTRENDLGFRVVWSGRMIN